jgi:uncharacterized protein
MRVIDTSLWIELVGKGPLMAEARKYIEPLKSCIVPTMVQYELWKWCNRVLDEGSAKKVFGLLTECEIVEMNSVIAIEAAVLSAKHQLHATDAIIYATAQMAGATLYTSDAHFKGLAGVAYFEK